jgi:hypothetical protein
MRWRCFHCNYLALTPAEGREHFGSSPSQRPTCLIDGAEYRRMEEAYRRSCEEDTDLHRALHAKDSERAFAVRRAEEEGYARGLRDGMKVAST